MCSFHCAKSMASLTSGRSVKATEAATKEAEDYVESIMPSQRATRVDTPQTVGRKRHLSLPAANDKSTKKAKAGFDLQLNDGSDLDTSNSIISDYEDDFDTSSFKGCDNASRVKAKAKRSLYESRSKPAHGKSDRNIIVTEADVHVNSDPSLKQMIAKLSSDMHMQYTSLSERIDKLEAGLEQRISQKVAQLLDKRVNTELGRIRTDIDKRLETFKSGILKDMSDKVAAGHDTCKQHADISLNVAIRGLDESVGENVDSRVNTLIKDGLSIRNVTVQLAERKKSENSSKPGIVVASFKDREDKELVMSAKSKLKHSRQFSHVFINNDQTREQRLMSTNFRQIVNVLNEQGNDIHIRGNRIVGSNSQRNNNRQQQPADSRDNGRSDNGTRSYSNFENTNNQSNIRNDNGRNQNGWSEVRRGGRGNARRSRGGRGRFQGHN